MSTKSYAKSQTDDKGQRHPIGSGRSEPLDLFGEPVMRRSAEFAGNERIVLSRRWGPGPIALAVGCNPSTADALKDDPTSLWWNAWFELFGFGGYDAVNLYPFCTPSPVECRKRADWHLTNDWYARDQMLFVNLPRVVELAKAAHQVFVCWGNIAWDDEWIEHVVEEMQTGVAPYPDLWCWGKTLSGAPKHPLARGKHRIPREQRPILWRAAQPSRIPTPVPPCLDATLPPNRIQQAPWPLAPDPQ